MKIAVIGVKGIPSNQGEIERYCQEFYPRIAARGHQVDLFVEPKSDRQPWFSVGYYHKVRIIALASLPRKHISFWLNSALSTIWASLGKYDVIHIHGTKAAWFAWFPQLFSESKIVVTSHQLDCDRAKRCKVFRWLLPWIERTAIENADEVVVVSKALGEYFQQKYNIRPRYIPNAPGSYAETDLQFSYGKSLGLTPKRYILYLGTLNPENKPDLLLQAFQKLEPLGWKLMIAGEIGDSMQYAIELLALAKQNQNIIFTNEIRGKHLAEIVKGAGLLVAPTDALDLGLPLALLQAMREKIPVLASDRAVHQELIGKDRGLLFESGKLDSLEQQLQYALSEPSVLTTMTQKAQTYVAINHNWDRVTYGNLSLYLKITAKICSQSIQHNA
ncbi:glycosyltransferase family 4 protein [Waterburya agarophytonicola K14]|uniref:Glycosyltransferase family 4 protein n=1 Tax=Waterburya agarophytonicola KI4 TaxID=2874699 RepID=A0A964BQQ9_9CYAN|nr:glycosyltransferase family 4 protein [Waterburya agarophytonicola]MCC0176813.1 glycosyltransferase family 4 protein [Waterburya agarophytonicola KI4]